MPHPSRRRTWVAVGAAGALVVAASLLMRAGSATRDRAAPAPDRPTVTDRVGGEGGESHGAAILPAAPYAFNQLSVRVDGAPHTAAVPAAGAPAAVGAAAPVAGGTRTIWSVDGQDVGEGPTLSPGTFHRGDEVRVRIERTTRAAHAQVVGWASARIRNAPPAIRHVDLQAVAGQPDQVEALVEAADPDGDPVTLAYRWTVDGQTVEDAAGARFTVGRLARGQSLSVSVTANDGTAVGLPGQARWSQENRPPSIVTSASVSVSRDELGQARVTCPVQVSDPDGDTVAVELVDAPEGLAWDTASGSIVWTPAVGVRQAALTVRARDDKGGESQRTLQLSF